MIGEQIKIVSVNCQGLRDKTKRLDVWNYLSRLDPNILCLQDTHLTKQDENDLSLMTDSKCLLSGTSTNSCRVVIILRNNFNYQIIDTKSDNEGNLVYADLNINSITFRLINIYAPNNDTPSFFRSIDDLITENNLDHLVICGDFNLVLDPNKDCYNYININNPKSRFYFLDVIRLHNLVDSFRHFHPETRRYTWRRKNPIKQARLFHCFKLFP